MSGIKMKNDFPKITVVTITFNAEKFLEDTILSVINQDYPNIEYIIIDGASSDGTLDIIKKYEKHITFWISEPDNGIYYAMNKGIDKATGEWINFMNAGDSFVNNSVLSDIVKFLDEQSLVVVGYTNILNESKQVIYSELPMQIENILTDFRCNHQSTFTKMEIAKNTLFNTTYKFAADVDFFMKIKLNKNTYKILPFPVANFLLGGLWQQNALNANIEMLNIISNYSSSQKDIFDNIVFKEIYLNFYKNLGTENNFFNFLLNKLITNIKIIANNYKRIILYGYGHAGKIFYENLSKNIVAIVDKNHLSDNNLFIEIENLNNIEYDCILISVLGREDEISSYLYNNYNIKKDKIITINL